MNQATASSSNPKRCRSSSSSRKKISTANGAAIAPPDAGCAASGATDSHHVGDRGGGGGRASSGTARGSHHSNRGRQKQKTPRRAPSKLHPRQPTMGAPAQSAPEKWAPLTTTPFALRSSWHSIVASLSRRPDAGRGNFCVGLPSASSAAAAASLPVGLIRIDATREVPDAAATILSQRLACQLCATARHNSAGGWGAPPTVELSLAASTVASAHDANGLIASVDAAAAAAAAAAARARPFAHANADVADDGLIVELGPHCPSQPPRRLKTLALESEAAGGTNNIRPPSTLPTIMRPLRPTTSGAAASPKCHDIRRLAAPLHRSGVAPSSEWPRRAAGVRRARDDGHTSTREPNEDNSIDAGVFARMESVARIPVLLVQQDDRAWGNADDGVTSQATTDFPPFIVSSSPLTAVFAARPGQRRSKLLRACSRNYSTALDAPRVEEDHSRYKADAGPVNAEAPSDSDLSPSRRKHHADADAPMRLPPPSRRTISTRSLAAALSLVPDDSASCGETEEDDNIMATMSDRGTGSGDLDVEDVAKWLLCGPSSSTSSSASSVDDSVQVAVSGDSFGGHRHTRQHHREQTRDLPQAPPHAFLTDAIMHHRAAMATLIASMLCVEAAAMSRR